jgi:hypothetical protein
MKREALSCGILVALLVCAALLVLPLRFRYYADLRGLSTTELAKRLSQFHGVSCRPECAEARDGTLAVTCAGGQSVAFYAALPCEESFACGTLVIDSACWTPK